LREQRFPFDTRFGVEAREQSECRHTAIHGFLTGRVFRLGEKAWD
jgi:hypothetical protein